ncbi:MAG: rRNA pseudouridine synthase [Sedimentisphaerales bacterium]|nr:rRNA pseudouridine synthase [Sedimentisphaerales bacterium]
MSDKGERLQKVMAEAGIASRRHCEELILDGQVKVNGRVVRKLPVLVDPAVDTIVVAGRKLAQEQKVYYLLHKPKNVVCTNNDPEGRKRAIDLLVGVRQRVYPVGRLDADSMGLLIMTNDGDLANRLTHPRYGVIKKYVAEVSGSVSGETIETLKRGVYLDEGKATIEHIKVLRRGPNQSLLEIELREGRNRQIRRMLARLGHPVRKLTRIKIGKLNLRGLGPGKFRQLTKQEVTDLCRLIAKAEQAAAEKTPAKKRKYTRKAGEKRQSSEKKTSAKRKPTAKTAASRVRKRIVQVDE